jgi:hypothetical protein
VRNTQLSFYLKITAFYTLLFIASFAIAQDRTFKPNQIIDIGGGQKLKILKCKGEGATKECEVIQLVNNKQVGNSFWLVVSKIHPQVKATPAKVAKVVTTKKVEEKKIKAPKQEEENLSQSAIDSVVAASPVVEAKTLTPKVDTLRKAFPHKYYVVPPAKLDSAATVATSNEQDTSILNASIRRLGDATISPSILKNIDSVINKTDNSKREDTAIINTNIGEEKTVEDAKALERQAKKLGIFIDCNADCDMNYIKTQLPIVDFLLDMTAADVHVLINQQNTGGGGKAVQMIFYGQNRFDKMLDTVEIIVPRSSTAFEKRNEILRGLKAGLVRYIQKTPDKKLIDVTFKNITKEAARLAVTNDNWNYWVLNIGSNCTFDYGDVYKTTNASAYITAERTTDKLRTSFSIYGYYNDYKYSYRDQYTSVQYEIINRNYLSQHNMVFSLGSHNGVAYQIAFSKNTFNNNKGRLYGKAAFEYSIFPYKDVNTRLITLSYGIDIRANQYYDTTIYFLTREVLVGQMINVNTSFNQKWGIISSTFTYSNFFKDAALNSLSVLFNLNLRITGGLALNIYTYGSRVQDQVYLSKGSASLQDILARGRQLASKYNFSSGIGLVYRFGSKLNNFVNPTMQSL